MLIDIFSDGAVRSGNARNIMRAGIRVFGSGNIASIRGYVIGPTYMQMLDRGATIYPKNAKKLAIPLYAAIKPDGTPKLPGPRSWKNVVDTFIYKAKSGRSYIAYENGAGRLVFLYVLLDEVEIEESIGLLRRPLQRQLPLIAAEFGAAFVLELANPNPSLGRRAGLSPKYDRRG
jgi:hypothetical protein